MRSGGIGRTDDRRDELQALRALERVLAGRHLVEEDAERPDVALEVGRRAVQHFRRHVGERSGNRLGRRRYRRRLRCAVVAEPRHAVRQSEIEHLGAAVGGDDDVAALEIAVDDVLRVRVLDRVGDLQAVARKRLRGEPPGGMRVLSSVPCTYSMTM